MNDERILGLLAYSLSEGLAIIGIVVTIEVIESPVTQIAQAAPEYIERFSCRAEEINSNLGRDLVSEIDAAVWAIDPKAILSELDALTGSLLSVGLQAHFSASLFLVRSGPRLTRSSRRCGVRREGRDLQAADRENCVQRPAAHADQHADEPPDRG